MLNMRRLKALVGFSGRQSPINLSGDVRACDQARAFEVPRRILMLRTPHEIVVLETDRGVIPTAVAGVPVDHPVGRVELIRRVGKAADHDRWRPGRPGQPSQAGGEAYEHFSVRQPARALHQGPVAGLVLDPVRDMRVKQTRSVDLLLIDADNTQAFGLQVSHHLMPAGRIVPHLAA